MRRISLLVVALSLWAGCRRSPVQSRDADQRGPALSGDRCQAGRFVAKLKATDGVTLAGDFYATGKRQRSAVILLHDLPGRLDRRAFALTFIEMLREKGLNVLSLDRRGSGQSAGQAKDASKGPRGKLDVVAAYEYLVGHDCQIDGRQIALVAAGDGTASALDYTVLAKTSPKYEWPRALVLISAGAATEQQHRIDDHRDLLESIPLLFVYGERDATWPLGLRADAPSDWQFASFAERLAGTRLLSAQRRVQTTIGDFLWRAIGPQQPMSAKQLRPWSGRGPRPRPNRPPN
ncbi:MAG: hypothetical protein H6707_17350 [Deltaproteobacteria bacterium]|nr:hypothetical protein [Deltaproteobacteria bacterium]